MKIAVIIAAALIGLAGCSYETVRMQNPQTGAVADCGPYRTNQISGSGAALLIACVDDFKQQGYVRVAQ